MTATINTPDYKANFGAISRELCSFLDDFLQEFNDRSLDINWNLFKNGHFSHRYLHIAENGHIKPKLTLV